MLRTISVSHGVGGAEDGVVIAGSSQHEMWCIMVLAMALPLLTGSLVMPMEQGIFPKCYEIA